jgi:hypothetical protein
MAESRSAGASPSPPSSSSTRPTACSIESRSRRNPAGRAGRLVGDSLVPPELAQDVARYLRERFGDGDLRTLELVHVAIDRYCARAAAQDRGRLGVYLVGQGLLRAAGVRSVMRTQAAQPARRLGPRRRRCPARRSVPPRMLSWSRQSEQQQSLRLRPRPAPSGIKSTKKQLKIRDAAEPRSRATAEQRAQRRQKRRQQS